MLKRIPRQRWPRGLQHWSYRIVCWIDEFFEACGIDPKRPEILWGVVNGMR